MRTSYDPAADASMVRFAPKGTPIDRTEEVAPDPATARAPCSGWREVTGLAGPPCRCVPPTPIAPVGTGQVRPGWVCVATPYRTRETAMQNVMGGTGAGGQVATDETDRLIASNKVEGTAVYNRQGERLGSVYNFMVDKRSGQVAYAVMSFGGFLGMGDSYHPLPWKVLTYDTGKGGYVVDLDKDRLKNAPSYTGSEAGTWNDPGYGRRIDEFYGAGFGI
jgi:hypothetical protein